MANRMEQAQRRRLLEQERREHSRAEEIALEDRLDETQALGEARGAEYDRKPQKRGEGRKPMRRLSGLEWLHGKKRITDDQFAAGVRYGQAYRRAIAEQSIKSILNREVTSADGPTLSRLIEHAEGTVHAKLKLAMYRNQLMGEVSIITACDLVCGDERTPREAAQNGRAADAVEALLIAGLNLLIQHLAPSRTNGGRKTQDIADAA